MSVELIRKAGGSVSAYDDSVVFNNAMLGQSGIVFNSLNECKLSYTGDSIVIQTGTIIVQGRQVVITSPETITLTKPSSGDLYYLIYLKIDTTGSQEKAEIVSIFNNEGYPALLTGDDIIANRNGVTWLELYHIRIQNTGIVEYEVVAPIISSNKCLDESLTAIRTHIDTLTNGFLNIKEYYQNTNGTAYNLNQLFNTGNEKYLLVLDTISQYSSVIIRDYSMSTKINVRYYYPTGDEGDILAREVRYNSANVNNYTFYTGYQTGSTDLAKTYTTGILFLKSCKDFTTGDTTIEISTMDSIAHINLICKESNSVNFDLHGKFIIYKIGN